MCGVRHLSNEFSLVVDVLSRKYRETSKEALPKGRTDERKSEEGLKWEKQNRYIYVAESVVVRISLSRNSTESHVDK